MKAEGARAERPLITAAHFSASVLTFSSSLLLVSSLSISIRTPVKPSIAVMGLFISWARPMVMRSRFLALSACISCIW